MSRFADPGRVTIRDVADAAEVHISTVSRALDPDKSSLIAAATRDRVLAAADQLGYQPHLVASGLRRGRTRTVGVVLPDLGNPIYAPFARGLTHALDRGGIVPVVADTEDDHGRLERVLRHLTERRVDAIVVAAARLDDAPLLTAIVEQGVPVVTAVRILPGSGLPQVFHDDHAGGRLAGEHLADLGHQRVARVRGPQDVQAFQSRSAGFVEGIGGTDRLTEEPAAASAPDDDDGLRVTRALLDLVEPPPTAIFAENDALALGVLQALREAGLRCPEDISVVGYNDAPFAAHAAPPLTTIRLSAYDVGWRAGTLAMAAIDRPDEPHEEPQVPPELVVRRSTAPPRDD